MTTRLIPRNHPASALLVARGDACAAADAAERIASDAARWAASADAGVDDAAEAVRCAARARLDAQRAERCTSPVDAWACARQAWAAVSSVVEASSRVNAAIAEDLVTGRVPRSRREME